MSEVGLRGTRQQASGRAQPEAAGDAYIAEFNGSARFKPAAFDEKAAVEHALYTRKALDAGDKFGGVPESWAKVKFDRQIVAIAVAQGVSAIYTDDEGLRAHAEGQGVKAIRTSEMMLDEQPGLFSMAEAAEPPKENGG